MIDCRIVLVAITVISMSVGTSREAVAQRIYTGSTSPDLQYPRSSGLDSNGRATNVDARSIDQYGTYTDDFGQQQRSYGVPGHYHGGGYTPGGYYPGNLSGLGYSNSLGYTVGLSGYSGGYYSNASPYGGGVVGSNPIAAPRSIIVGGPFNSRTVMNNATRGGVIEYTHNGNGYVYSPGSSYQTVIQSGPSIFPYTSVIQPTQPPVIIEARKSSSSQTSDSSASRLSKVGGAGEIKLMFPKSSAASLSYQLNGTVYTIKPGYVQTFADDRVWTIEFLRGGNRSQVLRYQLTAGTYLFDADENGWDLKQAPAAEVIAAPAPVPPPVPASDL